MGLNLGDGEKSLFPHNRDFSEGIKERGIRQGLSTVVVAVDGSGDADTIHEGIKLLPGTGGIVYIKEGTYLIKSKINITTANIKLQGTGAATILYLDSGVNDDVIYVDAADVRVEDLKIDGNKTNNATGKRGIFVHKTNFNCHLVTIINTKEEGVFFNSSYGLVSNTTITDSDGWGIRFDGNHNIVNTTIIKTCGSGGILIQHGAFGITAVDWGHNTVTSCLIYKNTSYGINLNHIGINDTAKDTVIVGNNIYQDTGDGLLVDTGVVNTIVVGNYIYSGGTSLTDNGTGSEVAHNILT